MRPLARLRDCFMSSFVYRLTAFLRFWAAARTVHRVHSPLAFAWAHAVLEDQRHYYAFDDIEALRRQMCASPLQLDMEDYGAGEDEVPLLRRVPLRRLARRSSSTALQGRWLFRTAQWLRPLRVLEMGTSLGIGTAYLAAGAGKQARLLSLEGCPTCARIARTHLDLLHLAETVRIYAGPFARTLPAALEELGGLDLVFFDGHHRAAPTLTYWDQCLPYVHERSVFVFDDIYWSAEMRDTWQRIQAHPRVRLTLDCFELALVFFDPAVREKQHFRLVPTQWKPWERLF